MGDLSKGTTKTPDTIKYETSILNKLMVIKRTGDIVPYDRSRVENALSKAIRGSSDTILKPSNADINNCIVEFEDWVIQSNVPQICIEIISDFIERALIDRGFTELAKSFMLFRSKKSDLRKFQPNARAISDYITYSKYVRPENKSIDLTINRLKIMYLNRIHDLRAYSDRADPLHPESFSFDYSREIDEAINLIKNKTIVPSMRSMQFAGKAIEVNHTRMYNCSYMVMDDMNNFTKLFYLLLSGCGVGYSVQTHHIAKLPKLCQPDKTIIHHHTIEDTIEGWAIALGYLMQSYNSNNSKKGTNYYVEFNYSKIRSEGSKLKTSGGFAPGHLPLRNLLESIRSLLDYTLEDITDTLDSRIVHEICCRCAEAVLSGGVRRASLICLFSPGDSYMENCKTESLMRHNSYLRMANNSVVLDPNNPSHVSKESISYYINLARQYGEPGIFFTSDPNCGTNPCGEIGLDPFDPVTQHNGVSFCNLTEINAVACTTQEKFNFACYHVSLLGTIQSSFTDFHPILGTATKNIAKNTPLLGVSVTGILDNPKVIDWMNGGIAFVKDANDKWSKFLGINPAIRLTTVKPSGTASLYFGNVSSGIHPHHSKRYIRRVLANVNEYCLRIYERYNPYAVKDLGKNSRDKVIEFPVQAQPYAITLDKLTPLQHLELIRKVYENWIEPGYISGNIEHNVSATVEIPQHSWSEVIDWIVDNKYFHPISFFPKIGDKVYKNAPREAVYTESEIDHWKNLITTHKPIDYPKEIKDISQNSSMYMELGSACDGPSCQI